MKTGPELEIIEIIDDDGRDAFGELPKPSRAVRLDPRRTDQLRRWGTPAAAAIVGLVVGFAVISSIVTSGNASTASNRPQYYVADPVPAGFSMRAADVVGSADSASADDNSAELWASKDATATTGAWFVVTRGAPHSTGANSYRTVVNGTEVVVEHDPVSRQAHLSFTKDGNLLELTAFNWIDRQMLRLVDSIYMVGTRIAYRDMFFTTDHKLLLRADPESAFLGEPVTRVEYTKAVPVDLAESFTITVANDKPVDREVAAGFALTDANPVDIGRRTAIAGHDAAQPNVSVVQFHDGDRLITVRGNFDIPRLVAIAGGVHPASNGAVAKQVVSAPPSAFDIVGEPRSIASGMLADGRPWTIDVSTRDRSDPGSGYIWWIGQPGDTGRPSETRLVVAASPSIETRVENGRTYVMAKVPRSVGRAELHVNPNGQPSVVSPLNDLDPAFVDLFTADVFLQPVPFTAEIVDGDGNTLVSWPVT